MAHDRSTSTDASAQRGWRIHDPVIRLREWGSDRVYGLPDAPVEWKIGTAPQNDLQLRDPQVSRVHARLTPYAGGWKIHDLESKNGLWRDGARRVSFALAPGLEIGIGGLRLVAESRLLIALRGLVARFLGWAPARQVVVDEALRSLRDWAEQRSALIVSGDGELAGVMRRLHGATLGDDAPFVACGEHADGMTAARATPYGALWSWAHQLPPDFEELVTHVRAAGSRTRLLLCARDADDAAAVAIALGRVALIALPPLAARAGEIERIVLESADDAARELGAPAPGFTPHDLDRLGELELESLADIEETVRRIVALRTWGVSNGASRLKISHVSLSRWARRRRLTT